MYWHRKTTGFPDDYEAEYTDTWQECQKICAKIEACKGFTWHKENSAYPKSCSPFSEYGWKGKSDTTVSGPKECSSKARFSCHISLTKNLISSFSFSARIKGISIMTGNRKDAEKITGDIFATIIETDTKYCTTHLLTNDKGVDRSSPEQLDHYSSEDRLGSRVRKIRAVWIARF